jgi:hypothetical protein
MTKAESTHVASLGLLLVIRKKRRDIQIAAALEVFAVSPATEPATVAPPTVMAMVIVPVVVNCRTGIDRLSRFVDWRYRSGESARGWS